MLITCRTPSGGEDERVKADVGTNVVDGSLRWRVRQHRPGRGDLARHEPQTEEREVGSDVHGEPEVPCHTDR
jgi:hypothetical protein